MPELRDELNTIEGAISAATPGLSHRFFGVGLMREGLMRRRSQLLEEIAGVLDLAITRDEYAGTGAELGLVASVLAALQDALASIAQVVAGAPTARGLIPASIKSEVELRLAAAAPGSLNLRLIPASPSQPPLFPDQRESLLDLSVNRLVSLLSVADQDRDALLTNVAELGPRVAAHIQLLTGALTDHAATASIAWRSDVLERSVVIDAAGARELREVLRSVQASSRDVVYTGRLVGGSLVRRTFELELELDPSEATVIAGRVDDDALDDLEEHFGEHVTATVVIRESRLPSGETKETHLLRRLSV